MSQIKSNAAVLLAAASMMSACDPGGSKWTAPSYNLNGTYTYTESTATVTGSDPGACTQTQGSAGTIKVTWADGSNQATVEIIDSTHKTDNTYTFSVSGNSMSFSSSAANSPGCDNGLTETMALNVTGSNGVATGGSGAVVTTCNFLTVSNGVRNCVTTYPVSVSAVGGTTCGASGLACCANGTCNGGLTCCGDGTCNSVCQHAPSCGAQGVQCCSSGAACNSGLTCQSGTCQAAQSVPAAPSNLVATATSNSAIHLIWTDSSNDETGFKLERSPDSSTWAQIATPAAHSTACDDTGLSPSTTYHYRIRATNSAGDSAYSNTVQATTNAGVTVPAAPSNLVATATSSSAIRLTWADNSTDETGFKLERSPDSSTWAQIAIPAAHSTAYGDTGLSPSTTYHYRIRATNSAGDSAYSNTAQATTGATTICSTGATKCIAGNAGAMLTCNSSGTAWGQSNCAGWQACAKGACRNVCGLTGDPSIATVCFYHIADGVNQGLFAYYTPDGLLLPGSPSSNAYTTGGATTDGGPDDAPVFEDDSLPWPYYWQFNGLNQQGMAYVEFTLHQFNRSPVTVTISAKAKAASNVYNDYFTGAAWLNSSTITPGGRINAEPAPSTYWTNVSLTCSPGSGTCDSNKFGYTSAAGINDMGLSMTALGSYLAGDDMRVNWVMLQVH